MRWKTLAGLFVLTIISAAVAKAEAFINLEGVELYDLRVQGFTLSSSAELEIDAVGRVGGDNDFDWIKIWRDSREDDEFTVYAWIIDSQTRRPVWVMDSYDSGRVSGNRSLRRVNEKLELEAGRYELYLYSGHGWLSREKHDKDWTDKSRYKWGRSWTREKRDLEEDLKECYVKIMSSAGSPRLVEAETSLPGALLQHVGLGDSEFVKSGFSLSRAAKLRVYSIIEFPKGSREPADYGWIVNADSRELVWAAADALSRRAGGSRKNRLIDEEIELDAGRYILYFGTDDSHSREEFNANPPHDPLNWGITLLPGEGMDRGTFSTFDANGRGAALIDFTRVGDGEFLEQSFRLERDGDVWIHALGEYDYSDREFVDYAWIGEAGRSHVVWEMTGRNTMGAGGAEKNRMFDVMAHLPKGDYTLFYMTDGSHSREEWNSATPFEVDAWGVAMYAGKDLRPADFKQIAASDAAGEGVLVSLVRVRDSERRRQKFTLDRDQRVHIYAVGEGDDGDMYDYGYIVDEDTGRTVWEMSWRNTVHAGGARKNRMFEDEVQLDAGEYTAWFVTDGSHSFEGFNASKPRDPMNWGLTIRTEDR